MAYEYENTVVAMLEGLGVEYNSNEHYYMAGEVEEVYYKAKILDKITDIVKTGHMLEELEDFDVTLLAIERELNYILEDK